MENENEITFKKVAEKENETNNFFSVFETKDEYEKKKKLKINNIFEKFSNKDKLLYLGVLLIVMHLLIKQILKEIK